MILRLTGSLVLRLLRSLVLLVLRLGSLILRLLGSLILRLLRSLVLRLLGSGRLGGQLRAAGLAELEAGLILSAAIGTSHDVSSSYLCLCRDG
jgi:hypothetical protein